MIFIWQAGNCLLVGEGYDGGPQSGLGIGQPKEEAMIYFHSLPEQVLTDLFDAHYTNLLFLVLFPTRLLFDRFSKIELFYVYKKCKVSFFETKKQQQKYVFILKHYNYQA